MKTKADVTEKDIEQAFVDYDKGIRPPKGDGSGTPRKWFVRNPNNQELYPSKQIYTLAVHKFCKNWPNNAQQRKNFVKRGYEIFDAKNDSHTKHLDGFQKDVEKSRKGSSARRKERLKITAGKPDKKFVYAQIFIRNPDVVAQVLEDADGYCQKCESFAPFKKRKTKQPYLEVHHRKPLSQGGADTVKNAIALCPNCHRKAHYG